MYHKNMNIKNKKISKRLTLGIEFELFTLNEQGYMINGADRLIASIKKNYPDIEVKRECGKNMIEIITPPHSEVPNVMLKAVEDFERASLCAKKEGMVLYAYGTYPGSFTPEFHSARRYDAQQKIFGKQRFSISGRVVGMHIHYSLPYGVFDRYLKILKPLVNSKNKESTVNIYNLCVALDPALTTLCQSSPFYQSQYLAKDSRVVVYRGGKELDYPQGLYANFPEFGALQSYKSTNTDILSLISERFSDWSKMVKNIGYNVYSLAKHSSILDNTWNPVKINAHGTMEIRGMDMNHPDIVVAVAIMVKFIIKEVQDRFIKVVPSESAIAEPFKFDGDRIFIPPDSHVRNELQKLSSYEGLDSDKILNYCQCLLRLAKELVPENRKHFLKPVEDMLRHRRTASDRIVEVAKEIGIDTRKEISPGEAAKLALSLSKDLDDEIMIMKKRLLDDLGK